MNNETGLSPQLNPEQIEGYIIQLFYQLLQSYTVEHQVLNDCNLYIVLRPICLNNKACAMSNVVSLGFVI